MKTRGIWLAIAVIIGVTTVHAQAFAGMNPKNFPWTISTGKAGKLKQAQNKLIRQCKRWARGGDGTRSCHFKMRLKHKIAKDLKNARLYRMARTLGKQGDVTIWLSAKGFKQWNPPRYWKLLYTSTTEKTYRMKSNGMLLLVRKEAGNRQSTKKAQAR